MPSAHTRSRLAGPVGAVLILAATTGVLALADVSPAGGAATVAITDAPPADFHALLANEATRIAPDLPYVAPGQPGAYDRDRDWGTWAAIPGAAKGTTRDAILERDLVDEQVSEHGTVVSGTYVQDPYNGARESGPAKQWDIDHRYPPGLAWWTGAQHWTQQQRVAFYNDPDNLVTAPAALNRAKGDEGPETWLPPVHGCAYAVAFLRVEVKYALTTTPDRQAAIENACGR